MNVTPDLNDATVIVTLSYPYVKRINKAMVPIIIQINIIVTTCTDWSTLSEVGDCSVMPNLV